MTKHLLVMMLSSVTGYAGWWIGDFFGFMTALIVSTIASFYGIYLGYKLHAEYLEW